MKMKFGMQALSVLLAMLLVSVAFVPAVGAQPVAESEKINPDIGKVVYFNPPELEIKENTDTSTIVQVGDALISLKNNREQKTAVLETKNVTTGETTKLNFEYYENDGKYYTTMYDGQASQTFVTEFDPFKSIDAQKTPASAEQETITTSSQDVKASTYWWDSVLFTSGYGVKYPHPDYASYGINPWDTCYIQGNQLKHTHYSKDLSGVYANLPAIVSIIALVCTGGSSSLLAKVIEGIGGLSGIVGPGSILFDEEDCIWGWQSDQWALQWFWYPPGYTYAPKYMRIASFTLWDDLGVGNP